MRSYLTRFAVAAVVATTAISPPAAAQTAAESALLRLARWHFEADFKADRTALDTLLADDLSYGRSSGALHTKAQVLALVGASGPFALDYSTPDSLVARAYDDAGVVTGRLTVKLTAQPAPYTLRFTETWVRRGGRWQLVAFQATRLP
ncbi:MAG: nuclear transport factor 2 family protein [Gemmatimonadaceae bacterium]|nr:nuclear transport factor 2 family protein [Gemmatimonadaceae bacterium]